MLGQHDLVVLTCGGTFDKVYGTQGMSFHGSGAVPGIVRRMHLPAEVVTVMQKDSLDMEQADRHVLGEVCAELMHPYVVVVHGTDTMVETARSLAERRIPKRIVLTGAFLPWCVRDSDAEFNLGFACGCVRYLPHGVYIAMHGTIFPWDGVVKDVPQQRFFPKT